MFKFLIRPLLRGIAVVLPIAFTLYIIIWLLGTLDSVFGSWLRTLLTSETAVAWFGTDKLYRPGMGIAMGLILILLVGFFFEYWLVRVLVSVADDFLARLPLVKSIYGSLRDLAGFISSSNKGPQARQVVLVKLHGGEVRFLGMVTRDDLTDLPKGLGGEDRVAVYVPFSYAWGGVTTIVPRSAIEAVDMTIEEAIRFSVTAGMSTHNSSESAEQKKIEGK